MALGSLSVAFWAFSPEGKSGAAPALRLLLPFLHWAPLLPRRPPGCSGGQSLGCGAEYNPELKMTGVAAGTS